MRSQQQRQPGGDLPYAHRPRPEGSFDATVLTFAALGFFDSLDGDQRDRFDDLLARFVERSRPGLVGFEMDRIAAAGGVGELHFAWAGGTTIDQPHYFRLQGPVTLVEFDNAEDNANHVHSVWRDPGNDFGNDLLMRHHLEHDHGGRRSSVGKRADLS